MACMGFIGTILDYVLQYPVIFVTGFLLFIFIYALYTFLSLTKSGPNPFQFDKARPPKPLLVDQGERDKVLKQGFTSNKIPERLDAVVIGSGIGGLSVAAILSKVGKRVLVLEQHDQAGGCCHTFEEKGFEFDIGIHYIGQMKQNTTTRLLVSQLTEGQLQWVDLINDFDHCCIGQPGKQKMIPFHGDGWPAWKTAMLEKFPGEEKALNGYIEKVKEASGTAMGGVLLKMIPKPLCRLLLSTGVYQYFTNYFKYAQKSVQQVLDELTANKELQTALACACGDYGALPNKAPFYLQAGLTNHYIDGASFPYGGASEIAFHIIPVIERFGGKVLVRAPVTKILTNDEGKAIGVRVRKGEDDLDIQAPLVISDAGVINTLKYLLPKEIAQRSGIYKLINKKVESGATMLNVFVGLKGTKEELGLEGRNYWMYTGNDLNQIADDFLGKSLEEVVEGEIPMMFVSFPSAKDPSYNTRYPGKSCCTIVTLANWEWFSKWVDERVKNRGEEYEALKNKFGKQMWNQVLQNFPQLADKVEYFEVATPVTNRYYLAAPKGEVYGLDNTVEKFGDPEVAMLLRPETDIPGLYLTGQDVNCCGFSGALYSGLLCSISVLHRNIYSDLLALQNKINKTK